VVGDVVLVALHVVGDVEDLGVVVVVG